MLYPPHPLPAPACQALFYAGHQAALQPYEAPPNTIIYPKSPT
jgi:hypothetical protein